MSAHLAIRSRSTDLIYSVPVRYGFSQVVREAMLRLKPRCREMIRMLFFEEPAKPYDDVAKSLGLATGSIGFIRARCLKQMMRALEELGL